MSEINKGRNSKQHLNPLEVFRELEAVLVSSAADRLLVTRAEIRHSVPTIRSTDGSRRIL